MAGELSVKQPVVGGGRGPPEAILAQASAPK